MGFGFGVDRSCITPIKNLPSRWERKRKRKAGARGGGDGAGGSGAKMEEGQRPSSRDNNQGGEGATAGGEGLGSKLVLSSD